MGNCRVNRTILRERGNKEDSRVVAGYFKCFIRLTGLGFEGKVIKSGKVYELIFTKCGCPLYTQTGIKSTNLCECSRQSMICVFKNLVPQRTFKIECMESILAGNEKCCHRIMFVE